MTQTLISLISKCAQGVGFTHQRDTVALLSPFCAGSGADGKDQSNGIRGAQLATQLLCQPGFCVSIAVQFPWDCVCHGLLPSCAKSLSAAVNFQDAALMFVARRTKRSLESSSCHVRAVVDQIERYLFHHSLCNFFTISWSWMGQEES